MSGTRSCLYGANSTGDTDIGSSDKCESTAGSSSKCKNDMVKKSNLFLRSRNKPQFLPVRGRQLNYGMAASCPKPSTKHGYPSRRTEDTTLLSLQTSRNTLTHRRPTNKFNFPHPPPPLRPRPQPDRVARPSWRCCTWLNYRTAFSHILN